MTGRSTEDLAAQLVRNLSPVKPIARLRVAAAGVVALWVAAVVVTGWTTGAWPQLGDMAFWRDPIAVTILLGLGFVAAAAVVAALASAIPGRERLAQASGIGAGLAAAWLIGCGLWAVGASPPEATGVVFTGCASCLAHALVLAMPAALAVGHYLSRGAPQHRRFASGVAAAGAAGLGALAVHTTCSMAGGFHLLLGHCSTPLIAGLVFALPLAALIRRWSRAASAS